jgi:hypothetical protein
MLSSVEAPASEPKGTRRMAAEMATSRRAASAFMAAHQGKAYAAPLALEAERKARRSLADSSAGTAAGWCRRQPLVAAHSYFFRHVCRARPTAARERLATWKVARSVWSGMPPPAGPPQVSQSPATTRAMEKENRMNHDLRTLEIASPGRWRSFLAAVAIACLPLLVHEARAHRSALRSGRSRGARRSSAMGVSLARNGAWRIYGPLDPRAREGRFDEIGRSDSAREPGMRSGAREHGRIVASRQSQSS